MSKEERSELKQLRHQYKKLKKRKEEEEKLEHSGPESSSDNEEDYVDELPAEAIKKMSGVARTSVSQEAFGRYHAKEEYIPVVIPKSDDVKQQIRDTLNECFMFNALENNE